MPFALVQFRSPGGKPSLSAVQERLGLAAAEIDERFDVVLIDPQSDLYAVRISQEATARVQQKLEQAGVQPDEGVFSDPRIDTFEDGG